VDLADLGRLAVYLNDDLGPWPPGSP
jgi:hypothetical protein